MHSLFVRSASFFLVLASATSFAPEASAEPRHHVFLEAGGSGVLDSVNYELQPVRTVALRVGQGVAPLCWGDTCRPLPITPVGVAWIGGGGNHHYEVGASATLAWTRDADARFVSPLLGYRYQRPEGGLTVRVTATPLVRWNKPSDVLPWAGASVGYVF
ncbi:MAG: hypothetical protein U0169_27630 [Polyangiaceae bacterium]